MSERRLQVEYRALADLIPYARNARTHSAAQVDQIAASMREFGWTNPVLIDESGTIIAGHGRVMAATKLGIDQVPVLVMTGLTETARRKLVLADNKIALNAGWDDKLLAVELQDLRALGEDLSSLAFSDKELKSLFRTAALTEGQTPEDAPIAVPATPVARCGDVWILGRHRLGCGDSTDAHAVRAMLGGVKPNLMVTDPPYGVNYDPAWRNGVHGPVGGARAVGQVTNDHKADWREVWALFEGSIAYVWHASLFTGVVQESLHSQGFETRSQIIWAKQHHAFSRGHYHWQHEPCWYAVRKSATADWAGDRKQTTLWQIANGNAFGGQGDDEAEKATGHGTQKPVECMRRPILNHTSEGQAVFDPFMGSGSTIIAAETTGRCAFGMEIAPAYVDAAVRRWQAFTGQEAVLAGTDKTFTTIAVERLGKAPAEPDHARTQTDANSSEDRAGQSRQAGARRGRAGAGSSPPPAA